MILIIAVIGRPLLRLVAGVLVQNANLATTAQRDLAAAVNDDLRPLVVKDFRGLGHRDGDGIWTAVERDRSAFGDCADHCICLLYTSRYRSTSGSESSAKSIGSFRTHNRQ